MRFLPSKKRNKYYYTLLRKITSTVLVTVFIISFFLYYNFMNFALDYINKSNLTVLHQVSNNVSQINNYATTFSSSLFNNSYCQQLMYGSDSDVVENLKSIRLLDNLMNSTPFIHSITVYNGKSDIFYYIGAEILTRKKKAFFDKELINMLESNKYVGLTPIPRRIDSYSPPDMQDDVLSYLIVETFLDTRIVKNALIVNININWVFNSIKPTSGVKTPGNIFLINENGKAMAHSDSTMFMNNLNSEEYIQKILHSNNRNGLFTHITGGEKSLVTYEHLQSPDWILVNTIPYNYIASSVNKVKVITIIISLLVLLLGILISLFNSRGLYSPVRSLLSKTNSLFNKHLQPGDKNNEFDYIATSISSAAEELNNLEYFKRNNINILKQQFLRSLLLNTHGTLQSIEQKCLELNLQLILPCNVCIIILKIDNYSNFTNRNSKNDQLILKFALANIAEEIICQEFSCETVDMENDHIVVIVNTNGKDDPLVLDKIKPLLLEISKVYSDYYSITVSSFVSNICRDTKDIPQFYRNTIYISNYRLVLGFSCILSQQEVEKYEFEFFDFSSWNIQILIDALKLGNNKKVQLYFESMYLNLYKCSYDDITIALSYISSMLFNSIGIIEKNSNICIEISYSTFKANLNRCETLEQMKAEFMDLFIHIIDKINFYRNSKSELIVNKIIKYIEANYNSTSLSSNTIAEIFNLTSPYLNKIFREATSRSLPDYITNFRIHKACSFLKDSDLTVDEVIGKIGWENKNYFFTVFKKTIGVTPTEYRLKQSITQIDTI